MNDDELLKAFGQQIRKSRKSRGWTQSDLAEYTGFHRTYIGMAERGERNVSLKNMAIFARAFEVRICELLGEL